MSSRKRKAAIALAATSCVLAGGLVSAPLASASFSGTELRVAITDHGLYLNGPTTFPAGRVRLVVDAAGGDKIGSIARPAPGYTLHDARTDIQTVGKNLFAPGGDKKTGLKALNHLIDNLTFYGGIEAPNGHLRHGVLLLDQPGTYYLVDASNLAPRHPVKLTVTSPEGAQTLPKADAKVVATTERRWRGDTVLPAHGNVKFVNKSTESPHFVDLEHVKAGTTRKQVIDSFSSNARPDFALPGSQETDVITGGHKMILHTHLPPGDYALMCFFPDPKTGMPHAFMGMVRIVHLK